MEGSCKGEPQGSYLREASVYVHITQPSACLHHKKENIQTIHEDAHPNPAETGRHVDTFSFFDITNGLSTNMVKAYIIVKYHIHKELEKLTTKKPTLGVFKQVTDLTYLQNFQN